MDELETAVQFYFPASGLSRIGQPRLHTIPNLGHYSGFFSPRFSLILVHFTNDLQSQAFASSLSGSLATRAVLEGVGVGKEASTPLAATLMWLIKDGTGMIGRILFAWLNG